MSLIRQKCVAVYVVQKPRAAVRQVPVRLKPPARAATMQAMFSLASPLCLLMPTCMCGGAVVRANWLHKPVAHVSARR